MATARTAVVHDWESDYRTIESWYRSELERTPPPTGLAWEPIRIGPTWQYTEYGWLLPRATLGWRILAWCGVWLRDRHGHDWQFTMEQARFLLWFYSLDETGRWLYSSAVLQRLKGWGKDPVLATVSAAACFGPSMFDRWNGDVPVGAEDPAAWVQLIAVSQQQTQNTMKLFPSLFTPDAIKRYGIQIGRLNVWGLNDTVQIEAITSNYLSVEGGRPTLVGRNEIQNWNSSNQGHEMAGAVEGNIAKSERGAARILDVCNAYRPGEDSVGQRTREAWETANSNSINIGVLYDSLEAPPEAPLTIEAAPAVVASIAGDSHWLDTDPEGRIVKSIANLQNPPSESRRKWYNQITATADAWVSPLTFDAQAVPDDPDEGERVLLFFDGSKSDDSTALVGVRISDGFVFTVDVWEKPPHAEKWIVDREDVDRVMAEVHEYWDVRGLWADPSGDARDDETGERFWDNLIDTWGARWGGQYDLPAVKTGDNAHAVKWEMRTPSHQKLFVEHAERFITDVAEGNLPHDDDRRLAQHVANARRVPSKFGVTLAKEHRESRRKIDAAVCAVGARMMWRIYQANVKVDERTGEARFFSL